MAHCHPLCIIIIGCRGWLSSSIRRSRRWCYHFLTVILNGSGRTKPLFAFSNKRSCQWSVLASNILLLLATRCSNRTRSNLDAIVNEDRFYGSVSAVTAVWSSLFLFLFSFRRVDEHGKKKEEKKNDTLICFIQAKRLCLWSILAMNILLSLATRTRSNLTPECDHEKRWLLS